VVKLRDFVQGRQAARKQLAEVKSVESLVAAGHNPLHAAHLHGQNYLSVFGELANRLSEFETYRAAVAGAEETYVPGWPPVSPVSVSFFTSGSCLICLLAIPMKLSAPCALEIGQAFGISDDLALTLEVMGESAMGVYEHLGWHDGTAGLHDTIDGQIYPCIVPSNYVGRPGEGSVANSSRQRIMPLPRLKVSSRANKTAAPGTGAPRPSTDLCGSCA
jgi:hypothetical protein